MLTKLTSLSLLATSVWATIPSLTNYAVTWSDDFDGPQGQGVNTSKWTLAGPTEGKYNGEWQFYNNANADNVHLSGDSQLYIIPKRSSSGTWSSGRISSNPSFTCPPGKAMILQSEIWVPDMTGSPSSTDGLWPAFWTLGSAYRTGTGWPKCGEWDIFEGTHNLGNKGQGTLHYQDGSGYNHSDWGQTTYAGGQYHTWAIKIDRRNASENLHKIYWYLDGVEYKSVQKTSFPDASSWTDLATRPYFVILNMAIGAWDGFGFVNQPSASTVSGYASSLRVRYVAVYHST